MKKPDEIKKGLFHCGEDGCADCPYYDDCGLSDHFTQIARDAIVYIQQLEEREKSLYAALHAVMHSVDKWLDVEPYDFDKDDGTVAATRASNAREVALNAIEKAERERDAAVSAARSCRFCHNCKHYNKPNEAFPCSVCATDRERNKPNWEWCGICPENTKEDK